MHCVPGEVRARRPTGKPRIECEDYRDAYNKNERRKNKIGRREAVPHGVVHKTPRARSTVIVHHDHEGDGDAADHIERKQSLHPCGSRSRNGCGDGGGCSYRIIHGNSGPPLNERWLHPTLRGSGGFRQARCSDRFLTVFPLESQGVRWLVSGPQGRLRSQTFLRKGEAQGKNRRVG